MARLVRSDQVSGWLSKLGKVREELLEQTVLFHLLEVVCVLVSQIYFSTLSMQRSIPFFLPPRRAVLRTTGTVVEETAGYVTLELSSGRR